MARRHVRKHLLQNVVVSLAVESDLGRFAARRLLLGVRRAGAHEVVMPGIPTEAEPWRREATDRLQQDGDRACGEEDVFEADDDVGLLGGGQNGVERPQEARRGGRDAVAPRLLNAWDAGVDRERLDAEGGAQVELRAVAVDHRAPQRRIGAFRVVEAADVRGVRVAEAQARVGEQRPPPRGGGKGAEHFAEDAVGHHDGVRPGFCEGAQVQRTAEFGMVFPGPVPGQRRRCCGRIHSRNGMRCYRLSASETCPSTMPLSRSFRVRSERSRKSCFRSRTVPHVNHTVVSVLTTSG